VRPGRERLTGLVEVDETYLGGLEAGVDGRETATKSIVAIAVEIKQPRGFGRIRLQHVDDVSQESLIPFITGAVELGATVHTDGWQAYWTVPDHGYRHERTVMRQQSDPAHIVMPGVHRVASLLKRWLLGTHQGSVGPEHLDAYLNEFTFRFNRRRSRRRGLLFYRLLEQAVITDPVTYRSLIVNPRPGGRRPTLPTRSPTPPAIDRPWRTTNHRQPDSNRYPPSRERIRLARRPAGAPFGRGGGGVSAEGSETPAYSAHCGSLGASARECSCSSRPGASGLPSEATALVAKRSRDWCSMATG
jgi:transposase-like protein